jgi:hypothetical protein
LYLGIGRVLTGDPFEALADRLEVGFPGQIDLVAESLEFLKSFEVFRAHDAILH